MKLLNLDPPRLKNLKTKMPISKRPILLHYYITEACNCRCRFCAIWAKKNANHARLSDVLQNLLQAKKLGIKFVDFTGGEPLLHPQLPEMLLYAKRLGLYTSMTTNGILYPDRAGELVSLIDLLHISLDAATPQDHDKIRNASCFLAALQSIDKAIEINQIPDILFTVSDINLNQINTLLKLAQDLRIMLLINPVFPSSASKLSTKDIEYLLSFKHKPFVYVNEAIMSFIKSGGNDNRLPRCRVGDAVIVISPENKLLLPCYHHHLQAIEIENHLFSLWQSAMVKNQKKAQGSHDFCKGCVISCYFDPSFLYSLDTYYIKSIVPKIKYTWDKYIYRNILNFLKGKPKPAIQFLNQQNQNPCL